METLIVNKATKKDLALLLEIAKKIGIDVEIASKKIASNNPDKKGLTVLAKKVKSEGTKKAFERIGLDYDSYSRQ